MKKPIRPIAALLASAELCFAALALPAAAQQPNTANIQAEHAAMQKLSFLTGHWSGPITIYRGPGQAMHFTQSENVQYKLGGLVLLVEGKSVAPGGHTVFSALATIAYNPANHAYRFRAYNDGRYRDTKLTVIPHGFSWGTQAGPAHILNSMNLTPTGEWHETTTATVGSHPPFRSMDMTLQHHQ